MELTVMERLVLLQILPKEGNLLQLKIVRQLREELSFSEQEHATLNFQEGDGLINWDQNKAGPKEVELGTKALEMIHKALAELDKAGKLRAEYLDLCEKVGFEGADES